MVLTVYGYVPAWGLPDISPYVTNQLDGATAADTLELTNKQVGGVSC